MQSEIVTNPKRATFRQILTESRTIAVVGLSNRSGRTSNSVTTYLQQRGYEIYPVNPNIEEALGRKAYPDLVSLPVTPDIVLIFRRSEEVPPVVDQAIQVGARVVWMQTGIINEEAAEKARQAGLQVIMDKCIYVVHSRMFGFSEKEK